jgi:hypothetical protein
VWMKNPASEDAGYKKTNGYHEEWSVRVGSNRQNFKSKLENASLSRYALRVIGAVLFFGSIPKWR